MAKQWDTLSLDFAAIRTLRTVFDLASFSAAAEVLDVNQSTISYTMDRLRAAFGDPLFVRQGGGIAPTHRCVEIVERAGRLLDEFEALVAPLEFDPAKVSDTIGISCNYYEQHVIFPLIVKQLRRLAPNLTVEVTMAEHRGMAHLRRGEADLLIGPNQVENEDFYYRHLLDDYYVCVMDKGHPLAGARLSLDDYLGANHAVVTYGGNWRSPYLIELERRSLVLNRRFAVPSLSDLANILPGTDLISTVPSRMSNHFARSIRGAACPIPAPFKIGLTWTSRTHHSALHRWIRQLITEVCGRLPGPTESGAGADWLRGKH